MSTRQASIAANRFGLGPKPGELASISSPKQWLLEQLEGGDRHSDAFEGFASSSDIRTTIIAMSRSATANSRRLNARKRPATPIKLRSSAKK